MSPRNCFTSLGFLGGNIACILSSFSGTGAIPSPDMICPRYCMCFLRKLHLISFNFKSALLNHSKRSLRCFRCVSISGLNTKMSSR